jgi:hypothetical protein
MLLGKVRKIFTTREYADENDPTWIVENTPGLELPAIYLDVGTEDKYGFQEGYARFLRALALRGMTPAGETVEGGKHDMDKERRWFIIAFLRQELFR